MGRRPRTLGGAGTGSKNRFAENSAALPDEFPCGNFKVGDAPKPGKYD